MSGPGTKPPLGGGGGTPERALTERLHRQADVLDRSGRGTWKTRAVLREAAVALAAAERERDEAKHQRDNFERIAREKAEAHHIVWKRVNAAEAALAAAEATAEQLRTTLSLYADEANWFSNGIFKLRHSASVPSWEIPDNGERARAALTEQGSAECRRLSPNSVGPGCSCSDSACALGLAAGGEEAAQETEAKSAENADIRGGERP